jgi:hypothetical protein
MTESMSDRASTIGTERLWLTSFTTDDAGAVFAYASSSRLTLKPEANRWRKA